MTKPFPFRFLRLRSCVGVGVLVPVGAPVSVNLPTGMDQYIADTFVTVGSG